MRLKRWLRIAWGIALTLFCLLAGYVCALALSGVGICGQTLTAESIIIAVIAAAAFPAMAVLSRVPPWWLPPTFFCLLFPLAMIGVIYGQEWSRVLAALGCGASAYGSAWMSKRLYRMARSQETDPTRISC